VQVFDQITVESCYYHLHDFYRQSGYKVVLSLVQDLLELLKVVLSLVHYLPELSKLVLSLVHYLLELLRAVLNLIQSSPEPLIEQSYSV
jgi:hypothetical protein